MYTKDKQSLIAAATKIKVAENLPTSEFDAEGNNLLLLYTNVVIHQLQQLEDAPTVGGTKPVVEEPKP